MFSPGSEPARVAGSPDAVDHRAAPERHVAEVVPADHVARVLDGRALEAPAGPQGPQAVRAPLAVLEAQDRAGEPLGSQVRLVRVATSAGCARGGMRLDWRRKAHEERRSNQDGDEKQRKTPLVRSRASTRGIGNPGAGIARPLVQARMAGVATDQTRGWSGGSRKPRGAAHFPGKRLWLTPPARIWSWRSAHQS